MTKSFRLISWHFIIFFHQVPGVLRASMVSLSSQADLDLRQVFTQVGTYKGVIVAIKTVHKKYVDLTREVRKELKLVSSDINLSNIVPS
jgi:hypothetical protein